MDGDIAPLPDMLDVLHNYEGSVLLMDEAHASGAIGATGRGIYEHFGILPQRAIERGASNYDFLSSPPQQEQRSAAMLRS